MTAKLKPWVVGSLLLAVLVLLVGGCASGPNAGGGGQSSTRAQGTSVTVAGGPVTHPVIPWQDGLTLMNAFILSGFQGAANPTQLEIVRQKQMPIFVVYQKLYDGQDVMLEPGDHIEIDPPPPPLPRQ